MKLIFWDGTGVCLFAKRLEDGEFRWPKLQDGVLRLSAAQLSALLEGLDWRRVHEAKQVGRRSSQADRDGAAGRGRQEVAGLIQS